MNQSINQIFISCVTKYICIGHVKISTKHKTKFFVQGCKLQLNIMEYKENIGVYYTYIHTNLSTSYHKELVNSIK